MTSCSKIASMIRKYHNHKQQTTPWHPKEEPLNYHETPGRQIKQSNQLSLSSPSKWLQYPSKIQEFSSGGGSRSGQSEKKSSDNVFFVFFSPQLILQNSNGQFQRILSFFKVPEGVQHFPGGGGPTFSRGGGVQLFPGGGSNCLFPIETHITCDFPGGVRTPCPPSGSALDTSMDIK